MQHGREARRAIPSGMTKRNWTNIPGTAGILSTEHIRLATNAFGVFDMHGNVWEWVEDCYHDDYEGAPVDGAAWTTGDCDAHVVRGGSWGSDPQHLRAATRLRSIPANQFNYLGFRVGRALLTP
jgi:formylglycine-generating enzyme required for sulfatase activity